MEITEVRIKLMEEQGERLQAFCSITFDDAFVVRDLKIIEGASGSFVAMPSRKLTAPLPPMRIEESSPCRLLQSMRRQNSGNFPPLRTTKGRAKLYADIAHPINSVCREMIQQRVILAFDEEKARSKLPGYVPSYDDYEPEDAAFATRTASITTTQVQQAEKPHGPHKAPVHQPQSERVRRNGFGAGIFE